VSLDGRTIMRAVPPLGLAAVTPEGVSVFGGGSSEYPARETIRVEAPLVRVEAAPDGFVAVDPRPTRARFRRRETGVYGEVPYVEEWKPLPPRLHDFVEVERPAPRGRFAIAVHEEQVTGLTLAEARAYAAERGARLPTEDEWQLAAEAGVLERHEPLG